MVKIGLQFSAILENVSEVQPEGDDFRWYLKLKCSNCGEISSTWQYVCLNESTDTKGGRGSANMVQKCKVCSRENHMDIIKDRLKVYTNDDSGSFVTLIVFECRGIEPVAFDFRNGWKVSSSCSNMTFSDVDLSETEWYDYDDNANESVSITELEVKFIKIKK